MVKKIRAHSSDEDNRDATKSCERMTRGDVVV